MSTLERTAFAPSPSASPARRQRHRWAGAAVLLVWSSAWFWFLSRHGGLSWHYFVDSGRLFEDINSRTGGLHLYGARPDLQFGPVSVLSATMLLALGGAHALLMAQVVTAVVGGGILLAIRALAIQAHPMVPRSTIDRCLFVATVAFIPVWMDLAARFVHIDDMLALGFTVAALVALRREQVMAGALLLALGVDAKPWALPFVVLLLFARRSARLRALAAYAAVVGVAWVPFLISDPRTLGAAGFRIPIDPSSALFVLGLGGGDTPSWDRVVQIALGTGLAILAVRRGRWAAVVLVIVLARLVVDPGVHSYYAAGVLVGAVLWDLVGAPSRWPWWTTTSGVAFFALRWLPQPTWLHGLITIAFFLAAVALVSRRPAADAAAPGAADGAVLRIREFQR